LDSIPAHEPRKVTRRAECPSIADAHQIDAPILIMTLQFAHYARNVDAVWKTPLQCLSRDRFCRSEDQSLRHAHGFRKVESTFTAFLRLKSERNDVSAGVTHRRPLWTRKRNAWPRGDKSGRRHRPAGCPTAPLAPVRDWRQRNWRWQSPARRET